MDLQHEELLKYREIRFRSLNPRARQAYPATQLLDGLEGVHHVAPADDNLLVVRYDLTHLTLYIIEEALIELGFHLDNSLMCKLKRALYYYTEETQRANLGLHTDVDSSIQVFVQRYRRLSHGCRDGRPGHWRAYW